MIQIEKPPVEDVAFHPVTITVTIPQYRDFLDLHARLAHPSKVLNAYHNRPLTNSDSCQELLAELYAAAMDQGLDL